MTIQRFFQILCIVVLIAAFFMSSMMNETSPKGFSVKERISYQAQWVVFNTGTQIISFLDRVRASVLPPELQLWEMSSGYFRSQCLYVAAKLDIAGALMKKDPNVMFTVTPKSQEEIAEFCHVTNIDFLSRLLRSLVTFRIMEEAPEGKYRMSFIGELLWDHHPISSRALVISQGTDHYISTSKLYDSMVDGDGKTPFQLFYREFDSIWDFYEANPEHSYWFNRYMHSINTQLMDSIMNDFHNPQWTDFSSVIDVGGGQGMIITTLLQMKQQNNVTTPGTYAIFDLPDVVQQEMIQEEWRVLNHTLQGTNDSVRWIGGDFFQSLPDSFDLYVMKFILHDWADAQCIQILSNVHEAMKTNENARLIIIENVLLDSSPHLIKESHSVIDMVMVTMTSGKERTVEQYTALFEAAGLSLHKVINTRSPVTMLEIIINK